MGVVDPRRNVFEYLFKAEDTIRRRDIVNTAVEPQFLGVLFSNHDAIIYAQWWKSIFVHTGRSAPQESRAIIVTKTG